MQLSKFNLPVETVDLISTLEPENQGIVYAHLFAYIYHGTPVPADTDPRCRLIIMMILEKIESRISRARAAAERTKARAEAKAAAAVKEPETGSSAPEARPAAQPKTQPQSDTQEISPVAHRIIQNGTAVHDRIGSLGEAMFSAQMKKQQQTNASRGTADNRLQRHKSRR